MRSLVSKLWNRARIRNMAGMNGLQTYAFGQLIAAWIRRDDARRAGDTRQLADARFELDGARSDMRSSLIAPR